MYRKIIFILSLSALMGACTLDKVREGELCPPKDVSHAKAFLFSNGGTVELQDERCPDKYPLCTPFTPSDGLTGHYYCFALCQGRQIPCDGVCTELSAASDACKLLNHQTIDNPPVECPADTPECEGASCTEDGCEGDYVLQCANGIYKKQEPACSYGCVNGACQPKQDEIKTCTSGELRCDGDELQVCHDDSWQIKETCANGCDEANKACKAPSIPIPEDCVTGTTKCDGNDIVTCNDGVWQKNESPCPYGCVDSSGSAKCKENSKPEYTVGGKCDSSFKNICDGNKLLRCLDGIIYEDNCTDYEFVCLTEAFDNYSTCTETCQKGDKPQIWCDAEDLPYYAVTYYCNETTDGRFAWFDGVGDENIKECGAGCTDGKGCDPVVKCDLSTYEKNCSGDTLNYCRESVSKEGVVMTGDCTSMGMICRNTSLGSLCVYPSDVVKDHCDEEGKQFYRDNVCKNYESYLDMEMVQCEKIDDTMMGVPFYVNSFCGAVEDGKTGAFICDGEKLVSTVCNEECTLEPPTSDNLATAVCDGTKLAPYAYYDCSHKMFDSGDGVSKTGAELCQELENTVAICDGLTLRCEDRCTAEGKTRKRCADDIINHVSYEYIQTCTNIDNQLVYLWTEDKDCTSTCNVSYTACK